MTVCPISSFTYAYDDMYNRRYVIHGHEGDKGDVYTYDNIYQLTNVKYNAVDPAAESQTPGSSTFDSQMTYNLDNTGNRTSTLNGATTSYTPDNMNQYTDVGGVTYSYDDNGNLTSDGTNTYQYDYENRLIQVTTPTDTITYKYDPFGRRIEKNVSGRITKFIYDGDQVIMETDDAGTMTAKYVYGTGIDEVIVMKRGGVYFYQYDGLGSVASITNSSGVRVESYAYDVYGKAAIKDGSGNPLTESAIGNPYMFTGRRFDKESELYYYRNRMYSAKLGRFLQRDPLNFAQLQIIKQTSKNPLILFISTSLYQYGLFNPKITNPYTMTANSPVNWVDPLGLFRFGKRPLSGLPWIPGASSNPIDDYFNTEVSHEHGFFEDSSGDNIGFGPNGRFSEDPTKKGYRYDDKHYGDDLMREALRNITDGDYSLLGFGGPKNNCQDWADRLRDEYHRLERFNSLVYRNAP